jgi:hypothetical protein
MEFWRDPRFKMTPSLGLMPDEMLEEIANALQRDSVFSFAMCCASFRKAAKARHYSYFETRVSSVVTRVQLAEWALGFGGMPRTVDAFACAAIVGNLEVFELMRARGVPWDWKVCAQAARHSHLDVLRWAHSRGCPLNAEHACQMAAYINHFEMLQWVVCAVPEVARYPFVCNEAAKHGNLKMLKWARAHNFGWSEMACSNAARCGHFEMLKFLRRPQDRCPWDSMTCAAAALRGDLEMLRWLRASDDLTADEDDDATVCPWSAATCAFAAERGHLEVLRWLRAPGPGRRACPWDETACLCAASQGHLAVMQWLRTPEPGGLGACPWDVYECENAARKNGHLEVELWVRSTRD